MGDNNLTAINGVTEPIKKPAGELRIAVIDDFTTKSVFIDSDKIPDISHGRIVKRFIEEGLPNAQIDTFDTKSPQGDMESINGQLDIILQKIDKGQNYKALNLSLCNNISFSSLSNIMDRDITPENIVKNKDEFKNLLYSAGTEGASKELKEIIQKLDLLSTKGVNIYISAGNDGKDNLNLFSLAENAKIVGATYGNGQKAEFSADNSLVNTSALGFFKITKVKK